MTRTQTLRIAVRKFPPFESAIRAQWQAFEAHARTGLSLDLVPLDLHPLEAALFTSGGMRSGEWDVAFVATDWIASMHKEGCAIDLAPLLAADPPADFPHGWSDSLLRLQRIGPAVHSPIFEVPPLSDFLGTPLYTPLPEPEPAILGVPYHDGPECLLYRRDLFEDPHTRERYLHQFDDELAPPRTWEDFHRIARFFHSPAKRLYGTAFAAFPDGHNSVYDFLLQLWTRGGDLFDTHGDLRFHSPAAVEALTFLREILSDTEAVHPACRDLDSVRAGAAFASGEVAMMVNWFGFAAHAHTAPDSAVRGLVDIADVPHGEGGSTTSLNVYWILSLASGSPHLRSARTPVESIPWQFLRHTLSPAMDKLTTTSGAIGCRKSTWHDPEINAAIPFYRRLDHLHAHAREIPQRPDWPRIASVIDTLVTNAITTHTAVPHLLAEADHVLATHPPVTHSL